MYDFSFPFYLKYVIFYKKLYSNLQGIMYASYNELKYFYSVKATYNDLILEFLTCTVLQRKILLVLLGFKTLLNS